MIGRSTWKDWLTLEDILCIHTRIAARPAVNEVSKHIMFSTVNQSEISYIHTMTLINRVWKTLGDGWHMEINISTLHVQMPGKRAYQCTLSSILTLNFWMTANAMHTYPIERRAWHFQSVTTGCVRQCSEAKNGIL